MSGTQRGCSGTVRRLAFLTLAAVGLGVAGCSSAGSWVFSSDREAPWQRAGKPQSPPGCPVPGRPQVIPKQPDILQVSWEPSNLDDARPAKVPGEGEAARDKEKDKEKEKENDKNGKDKNGDKEPPKHIRDNAFLVEEAVNQEPGQVQHILTAVHSWDRTAEGHTRDFGFAYTMELPLGSQTHQFSFTTQLQSALEDPNTGPVAHQGGVGDTFLNYRYQLLADDEFLWCAPRFSLILPTGDERFGLGTGQLGYQFNLPVSRYGEQFDYHFNAGFTYTPNVAAPLLAGAIAPAGEQDLRACNLGASVFWKPRVNLHFFVEMLGLWNEKLNEFGARDNSTLLFVNPGVRYAICQLENVEWVVGVSVPVGLTRDTPDIGVFGYMSVEHAFRKKKDDKDKEE